MDTPQQKPPCAIQEEQDACEYLLDLLLSVLPIEIASFSTCFGQTYWEWGVPNRGTHGVEVSFSTALDEAFGSLLDTLPEQSQVPHRR